MANNLGQGISALIPSKREKKDDLSVNKSTSKQVNMFTSKPKKKNQEIDKRFTTYLPPKLIKKIKTKCVKEDLIMKDFIREAIEAKLANSSVNK